MTIGTKRLENIELNISNISTLEEIGTAGLEAQIKKCAPNVDIHGFWSDDPYVYVECSGTEMDLCKMLKDMDMDIWDMEDHIDGEVLEALDAVLYPKS